MIAVVQRVTGASVSVNDQIVGRVERGLCALVAIVKDDTEKDAQWMANKLAALRVFPSGEKAYELDVSQVGGAILVISNFTVAADASRGRRPGFDRAMPPALAKPMFERFVEIVRSTGVRTETGVFGADMAVTISNDGPLTLILDSQSR